jgi:uncharacterized protein (DUF111 family)
VSRSTNRDRDNERRRCTNQGGGADGQILNAAPEFEDCVRLAGQHNLPAKTVQALAMKAWLDAGNREL